MFFDQERKLSRPQPNLQDPGLERYEMLVYDKLKIKRQPNIFSTWSTNQVGCHGLQKNGYTGVSAPK